MAGAPGRRAVLVVDGANVVGSRPDGWWRDRAGAARRLHDRLLRPDPETGGADLAPYAAPGEVVLVLEGRAREGVPADALDPGDGTGWRVRVVHAAGSGDDAVVEVVAGVREQLPEAAVEVVTADRGLVARVEELGASVRRPSWLLGRLDG